MSTPFFDYAIIGAGAAGLNLAMKMAKDPYFSNKTVLILDHDDKEADDRTWSFWEKGASKWDEIIEKRWQKARFYSDRSGFEIPMGNYHYKTIRSSNFYQFGKELVNQSSIFTWVKEEVVNTDNQTITTTASTFKAGHIFDSRIAPEFQRDAPNYQTLTQHFMGWFIQTTEDHFDENMVTMMDYRVKWKDHTSFTYVLPFSPRLALVEFTLFNNELLTKEEYEDKLRFYIYHYLKIETFTIKEVEVGAIPMSTYPFARHHERNLTKIGTAGGWVRPSSGYSFKNADRYSQMLIDNIKAGRTLHQGVADNRWRKYDKIFLKVLQDRNDLGEEIFEILYSGKDTDALFRFLDEESSLIEDLQIMFSLNKKEFRNALLRAL